MGDIRKGSFLDFGSEFQNFFQSPAWRGKGLRRGNLTTGYTYKGSTLLYNTSYLSKTSAAIEYKAGANLQILMEH